MSTMTTTELPPDFNRSIWTRDKFPRKSVATSKKIRFKTWRKLHKHFAGLQYVLPSTGTQWHQKSAFIQQLIERAGEVLLLHERLRQHDIQADELDHARWVWFCGSSNRIPIKNEQPNTTNIHAGTWIDGWGYWSLKTGHAYQPTNTSVPTPLPQRQFKA